MWFSHKLVWLHKINSKIILSLPISAKSITNYSFYATLIIKVNIGIILQFRKCFYVHKINQQEIVGKDTGFGIQSALHLYNRMDLVEVERHSYYKPPSGFLQNFCTP